MKIPEGSLVLCNQRVGVNAALTDGTPAILYPDGTYLKKSIKTELEEIRPTLPLIAQWLKGIEITAVEPVVLSPHLLVYGRQGARLLEAIYESDPDIFYAMWNKKLWSTPLLLENSMRPPLAYLACIETGIKFLYRLYTQNPDAFFSLWEKSSWLMESKSEMPIYLVESNAADNAINVLCDTTGGIKLLSAMLQRSEVMFDTIPIECFRGNSDIRKSHLLDTGDQKTPLMKLASNTHGLEFIKGWVNMSPETFSQLSYLDWARRCSDGLSAFEMLVRSRDGVEVMRRWADLKDASFTRFPVQFWCESRMRARSSVKTPLYNELKQHEGGVEVLIKWIQYNPRNIPLGILKCFMPKKLACSFAKTNPRGFKIIMEQVAFHVKGLNSTKKLWAEKSLRGNATRSFDREWTAEKSRNLSKCRRFISAHRDRAKSADTSLQLKRKRGGEGRVQSNTNAI